MKVLIIIPAYNEEDNIEATVGKLKAKCPDYDYVVINDCSKDNTAKILDENNFNHIDLCSNLGIGGAVQTGYMYALDKGYDIAVQMDGDGQHNCEYISEIIKPIIEGNADIVIGSRFISNEGFLSTGMRRAGIKFLSSWIKVYCGVKIHDVTSGFRAANKKFIEFYSKNYAIDYPEPEAIVSAAVLGGKIAEVPVVMNERTGGKSSISALKSVYYMSKVSIAILFAKIIYKGGFKK